MSTFKYAAGSQLLGTGGLDLLTANINAMLVSGTYSPSMVKDQYVSDIPSGAILVRSGFLTSPKLTNGVFAGNIPEIDAFLNVNLVVALVIFVDTGTDTTSTLLYYSSDGPGFPFVGEGFNYFIGYDQSNGGFFQV